MLEKKNFLRDKSVFVSFSEGELPVVTGEDAGLMKGLTSPSVLIALPGQHDEPATLVIDSTKPVYPRLE